MNVNRRDLFKGMAAAAALPLFNIGCAGFGLSRSRKLADGAKVRVALIGCGRQAQVSIDGLLCEDLVALVDPDPAQLVRLDEVVADTCDASARARYAKARRFSSYQDLFDQMGGELDAVVIETPNHQHALPAAMALRRGIHVYLDAPLCLTAAECDLILDEARRRPDLVTQCGTYGQSFPTAQYCIDRIAEGALGEVREVWAYGNRCHSAGLRPKTCPPPAGMDWDLWCGGSQLCGCYADSADQEGMHPHGWHNWIGYGNGSVGALGMSVMDIAFRALGLGDPDRVACHEAAFALHGAWAYRDAVEFHYPTSRYGHAVTLHWWDGLAEGVAYSKDHVDRYGVPRTRACANLPPRVLEEERENGFGDDPFGGNGALFVGSEASLWFTPDGGYRFMPRTAGWCMPRVDPPDDLDRRLVAPRHFHAFYAAIRAKAQTADNFEYAVPLAKTVCLGNVAARAGRDSVLAWDGRRVANDALAELWTTKEYRSGWNPFEQ